MIIQCLNKKCNHQWDYTGKSKFYATCPNCYNKVNISNSKRGLHKTDIEIIMEEALLKNNIDFVQQYPIRCKYGYIADFYLPECKLIIECDGEKFHKEGNNRDKKRDIILKNKGYIILRFKGEEIKNNIQDCINKIQEVKNGNTSKS